MYHKINYKLTDLIKEYDELEPLEKKEYISGICVSLVRLYETVYSSSKEEAVWDVFKDTEIFCEDYIYNVVSGSS
jgi:hypothetical protein